MKPLGIVTVQPGPLTKAVERIGGSAEHSRFHRASADDRDSDTEKLQLHPQRIRIFVERRFCHGINAGEGKRIERHQLARRYNNATAAAEKRYKGFVYKKSPLHVYIEYAAEIRAVHFRKRVKHVYPGKMYHGKKTVGHLAHLTGGAVFFLFSFAFLVGNVGFYRDDVFFRCAHLPVKRKYAVPLSRKQLRGGTAHSAVRAGYQNVFHDALHVF